NFNQPLNFDTSNVTDMSYMFSNCQNFNQPLNFNTSKVKEMTDMFAGCISLTQERIEK
ncbi:BspA family leucine-rich repeat surface protein, partial [Mycoplasmopsis anatis]